MRKPVKGYGNPIALETDMPQRVMKALAEIGHPAIEKTETKKQSGD